MSKFVGSGTMTSLVPDRTSENCSVQGPLQDLVADMQKKCNASGSDSSTNRVYTLKFYTAVCPMFCSL